MTLILSVMIVNWAELSSAHDGGFGNPDKLNRKWKTERLRHQSQNMEFHNTAVR